MGNPRFSVLALESEPVVRGCNGRVVHNSRMCYADESHNGVDNMFKKVSLVANIVLSIAIVVCIVQLCRLKSELDDCARENLQLQRQLESSFENARQAVDRYMESANLDQGGLMRLQEPQDNGNNHGDNRGNGVAVQQN